MAVGQALAAFRTAQAEAPPPAAKGAQSASGGAAAVAADNCILISPKQQGNPVLAHIKHVPKRFHPGQVPDYVLGKATCATFLSLQYHALHANYLHRKLKELRYAPGGDAWRLRLVLVLVDVVDVEKMLLDVTRT